MFWIKAFSNVRMLNVVMSLFYLSRGVSLQEIFYLSIFWAIGSLAFEIPSSYLADHWGRKKTILLGILFVLLYLFILIFAHGFVWLSVALFINGVSFACFSGTDEALVYDTARELGQEKHTLSELGRFRSGKSLFKIIAPVIGVLIARDLTSAQFITIIIIDMTGALISLILALRIIEPNHKMDVETQEAGVMKDAMKLLLSDTHLMRAILNKEILFFAFFMTWAYFQKFFVDLGIDIVVIGIFWGVNHALQFVWFWYVGHFHSKRPVTDRLNELAVAFGVVLGLFLLVLYNNPIPILLLALYIAISCAEAFRFPLFSELFHKKFNSYNRATTMSLSNLVHNILEYPLLFGAAILIGYDVRLPFVFAFVLSIIVILFLQLHKSSNVKA